MRPVQPLARGTLCSSPTATTQVLSFVRPKITNIERSKDRKIERSKDRKIEMVKQFLIAPNKSVRIKVAQDSLI